MIAWWICGFACWLIAIFLFDRLLENAHKESLVGFLLAGPLGFIAILILSVLDIKKEEYIKQAPVVVYRLEDKDGTGPFCSLIIDLMKLCPVTYWLHTFKFPTPEMEDMDIYKYKKNWYCAYKSLTDLNVWINKDDLVKLLDNFKLYEITIDEYQVGEEQIIFTKRGVLNKKLV